MNANVSFRHMDSSPALRDYATGKLERIVDKYVHGNIDADVVMSVEKFWHIANFTLQIKNLTIKGQERSEDMYSSIDLALAKIEKQLRRHKDRLRDHKPSNSQPKMFRMGVLSPLDAEEDILTSNITEEMEVYSAPELAETNGETQLVENGEGEEVQVLKQREYHAAAMTVQQAVVQLDLLDDREFFVFTNADSNAINVVFKRRDGNIGLIET